MKKFFVIAMLCVVPISFAGAKPTNINLEKRWYFGGGVNYSFENFKDEMDIGDWDNALGLDIKAGYCITDFFALEFMFQYLDEFKYDETVREYVYISPSWYYYDVDYKATVSLYNFTINGKGFIPIKGIVKPYGILGFGYAYGKAKEKITIAGISDTETDKESDLCGRIGAGLDIFLSEQFALEGEVSYFMGFNDIDKIRYTSLSLNAIVFF